MEYSKQTRGEMLAHRSELMQEIADRQRQVQAIDMLLTERGVRRDAVVNVSGVGMKAGVGPVVASRIDPASLRGMKQLDALKAIARANGGTFRTNEARRLMVAAGVVKNSKNSYKMVYNLIRNNDEFQPVSVGEYHLVEP